MTKQELDFIGSMNMCDEISNEAYEKIVNHMEETEITCEVEECIYNENHECTKGDVWITYQGCGYFEEVENEH